MQDSLLEFGWRGEEVNKFAHVNVKLPHLLHVLDVTTEMAFDQTEDKESLKSYLLMLLNRQ